MFYWTPTSTSLNFIVFWCCRFLKLICNSYWSKLRTFNHHFVVILTLLKALLCAASELFIILCFVIVSLCHFVGQYLAFIPLVCLITLEWEKKNSQSIYMPKYVFLPFDVIEMMIITKWGLLIIYWISFESFHN